MSASLYAPAFDVSMLQVPERTCALWAASAPWDMHPTSLLAPGSRSSVLWSALAAAVLAASVCLPLEAAAQLLRGDVSEMETGRPVVGGVVTLLGTDGARRGSVFTDDSGSFALRAPAPGRYSIRVDRLGYEPLALPEFEIAEGEAIPVALAMRRAALALRAVRVTGVQQCVPHPSAGPQTARVWQDVRSALAAASLTSSERLLEARLLMYTRRWDPEKRTLTFEESHELAGATESPFRSRPVEELERFGYVRQAGESLAYYAPDAEVLLSPQFMASHCFRLEAGPPDDSSRVGLAFEPVPGTARADVQGVLWLDRATGELRFLEFEYTNLPPAARGRGFGGRVDFERLPDERWIIPEWVLRIPILERATPGRLALRGVQEAGGKVLSYEATGMRSLLPPVAERLTGSVFDSTTMRPLADARVFFDGTSLETRTDASGRFAFDSIPPGRQLLTLLHSRLDTLRIRAPVAAMHLPAGRELDVALSIPSTARLTALACPRHPAAGMLLGHIRASDGSPVPFGVVRVRDLGDYRGLQAIADADGAFRVCNVPIGVELQVQAAAETGLLARPTYRQGPREVRATVRIEPGQLLYLDLTVPDPGESDRTR